MIYTYLISFPSFLLLSPPFIFTLPGKVTFLPLAPRFDAELSQARKDQVKVAFLELVMPPVLIVPTHSDSLTS